ncbi:hypothetical protein ACP70R_012352 [Stipagrostis hirtigluma subsp. patula]
MECVKSVQRAALSALPPDGAPYLAAGTVMGAVDADFSSVAAIELFGLDLRSDAADLPLLAAAPAPDRFHRHRWSRPLARGAFALGVLAGGLGDGTVALWNPRAMISSEGAGAEDAMVARLEKHKGPVRGLDFSGLEPHLLASGADEGEVIVWDLKDPAVPSVHRQLKNTGSVAQSEISYISWNPQHSHILASTSYNGITVIWDVDKKRPVINLSDSNRRRCSVIQWNPDMPNQLVIAAEDENSPLRLWDLRRAISPLREFVGHTEGVIDMSWCPYDSSFLLSCSKDNRTILWNTLSGEIVTEIPTNSNGNFDLQWHRKVPGVLAASSFDGKLGIYNLEFSGRYASAESAFSGSAKSRTRYPKWLECPAGASFGYGGKFVSFHMAAASEAAVAAKSEVHVHGLVVEKNLFTRSTEFEDAIQDGDKSTLCALCEKKSQDSLSEEERETWAFLKLMLADEDTARKNLLAHLGFNASQEMNRDSTNEPDKTLSDTLDNDNSLFGGNTDAQFLVDGGDDFLNNLQPFQKSLSKKLNSNSTRGETEQETVKHFVTPDPSIDASIQRALVSGDYKGAVNKCISANRVADALVIAHAGGSTLWKSTWNNYIKSRSSPYLKVIFSLVSKDLMSLVSTWPLNSWKETLALLCTYAQGEEWTVLCNTLASRLLSVGDKLAASLCYICAGNIDKTVEIWSCSLNSGDGAKKYIDLLQDLMEKTITLALATGNKGFSASVSKLVENYVELLGSQGLLKTAMHYLELLGSDEHSDKLSILKDRIALSTEENGTSCARFLGRASRPSNSSNLANQSSHGTPELPRNLYQVSQQHSAPNNAYMDGSQCPNLVNGGYSSAVPYQFPPSQMFVPPTTGLITQGAVSLLYPSEPPASLPRTLLNQKFPHGVSTNPTSRFMPSGNQGFVQRQGVAPVKPSSPTQAQPESAITPPAPPPTVHTVDSSNVPAELRPIVATLTRLFDETSRESPNKKREIEDNSRKIGALFAKLNRGDISPSVSSKLIQLCRALDNSDFPAAQQLQMVLTTNDWDECNVWLAALKRMIKARQNFRT